MASADILIDSFNRVRDAVHPLTGGLSREQLAFRAGAETSNSMAWLIWHLTRVQDSQVADLAGSEQIWTGEGYFDRFGLSLPVEDTGYGHDSDAVDSVVADPALLVEYFEAVHARTLEYLDTLSESDLDRIIDTRWDPPVTVAVRLVSTIDDDLQHAGQAAFARGLLPEIE